MKLHFCTSDCAECALYTGLVVDQTYHFQLVADETGFSLKLAQQVVFGHARGAAGLQCNVHQPVQGSRHLGYELINMCCDEVHLWGIFVRKCGGETGQKEYMIEESQVN